MTSKAIKKLPRRDHCSLKGVGAETCNLECESLNLTRYNESQLYPSIKLAIETHNRVEGGERLDILLRHPKITGDGEVEGLLLHS